MAGCKTRKWQRVESSLFFFFFFFFLSVFINDDYLPREVSVLTFKEADLLLRIVLWCFIVLQKMAPLIL